MTTFSKLGLSKPILKAISELGFEEPTEIQEKSIPHLLSGETDFIGLAQTGTGKTAAFGLPLLERIDPENNSTQALILAPTRELGQQIAEQLTIFSKHLGKVNVLAVYGGTNISAQIKALKRPQQVIIATPGRLIDLIKRKSVKLNSLQYLILDEADEMLNMGFKDDIDEILRHSSDMKLTWLFSATMPKEIRRIVNKYMINPIEVKVNTKNEVNVNIEHLYTLVNKSSKAESLKRFLDVNPEMRGVVFCRTKRDTQNLAEQLLKKSYKADALHGDLSQNQRDRVMKRFKGQELQVLIATDVAARGIDVDDLTHVFHYSLPDDISYYTHRSGRTARAGKKGISLAFISPADKRKINEIEKKLGISFQKTLVPEVDDIVYTRMEKWCLDLLDKKSKHVDENLLEQVNLVFANLTKEEILAKLVSAQLDSFKLDSSKDLNDVSAPPKENNRRKNYNKKRGGGYQGGKNKYHQRRKSGGKNYKGKRNKS